MEDKKIEDYDETYYDLIVGDRVVKGLILEDDKNYPIYEYVLIEFSEFTATFMEDPEKRDPYINIGKKTLYEKLGIEIDGTNFYTLYYFNDEGADIFDKAFDAAVDRKHSIKELEDAVRMKDHYRERINSELRTGLLGRLCGNQKVIDEHRRSIEYYDEEIRRLKESINKIK